MPGRGVAGAPLPCLWRCCYWLGRAMPTCLSCVLCFVRCFMCCSTAAGAKVLLLSKLHQQCMLVCVWLPQLSLTPAAAVLPACRCGGGRRDLRWMRQATPAAPRQSGRAVPAAAAVLRAGCSARSAAQLLPLDSPLAAACKPQAQHHLECPSLELSTVKTSRPTTVQPANRQPPALA